MQLKICPSSHPSFSLPVQAGRQSPLTIKLMTERENSFTLLIVSQTTSLSSFELITICFLAVIVYLHIYLWNHHLILSPRILISRFLFFFSVFLISYLILSSCFPYSRRRYHPSLPTMTCILPSPPSNPT